VRIAVSRDGPKVYVQDLLRKDSVFVHDWLVNRRGHIYISGSSNAMPREVREAVAWCISSEGAGTFSAEEAEAFVESMFEDGRGGEESW
jgi:sulfite reductase alpha subunit-like flavoprotein